MITQAEIDEMESKQAWMEIIRTCQDCVYEPNDEEDAKFCPSHRRLIIAWTDVIGFPL